MTIEIVIAPGGALGDFVLLWPMLRARAADGTTVSLVTTTSHGSLAVRFLPVVAHSIHAHPYPQLWHPDFTAKPDPAVERVTTFAGTDDTWFRNASAAFPQARIEVLGTPDRAFALSFDNPPPPRPLRGERWALHAGAGGLAKQWPLDRWIILARSIPSTLLAGEAERERWTSTQHAAFLDAGGIFLESLDHLADTLLASRGLIAADCGPAHLAAQLALPVISLFGPTDPARWSPVGPAVRVIAPPSPCPMTWLPVDRVLGAIHRAERQ